MKKLFMFLAVAGLATFGASCSSDDSSTPPPPPGEKQLVLSADKTTVNEGDSVTFTVKVGKDVVDADLYIQGTSEVKIDKTHKFETKGQYKVIAKKKDYKDSSVVTITVKEVGEPVDEKKLVLTPTKTEAFTEDVIAFTVKDEDGANVTGFTVKQADGTVVPNGLFSTTVAGTYKFVASKDGYVTSDEVSVVVKEKPVLAENFLKVGNVDYVIDPTKTKLLVNTINQNGENYIRLYKQTIEGEEISYCVFVMDVRTADFATSQAGTTGAVARFTKIVIQDPNSEEVLLPGSNPDAEVDMASWILSEAGEVDFQATDVTKFDVDLIGFQDGGTTKIKAENANGSASYDGVFDSMYSIDTTNQTVVATNAKAIKSGNKLVKLKKLAK